MDDEQAELMARQQCSYCGCVREIGHRDMEHAAPPTPPAPDTVVEALELAYTALRNAVADALDKPAAYEAIRAIQRALAASRAPGGRA